ncbi:MAG: poly-gamma-glutamate synthase PgsB [bacterium]|nr:poly-gamma-glutamate synthase PgsB [bacterium]
MKLILLLFLVLIVMGTFEMVRHRLVRRRVPIRIHINGSRGKSSVARLIAAGIQTGSLRVFAKTTGSAARVIFPDGREVPVRRRGAPNIREQLRIFRLAAAAGSDVIVLECMAVRPDLQWTCEHQIVGATHGVITNVRPDHLEAMGPRIDDVAESLSGTIPRRSKLFTAEEKFTNFFEAKSRKLGTEFIYPDPNTVTREELAKFKYVEFAENVALALAVCESIGVEREAALTGMWDVVPDIGALIPCKVREGDKEIDFINLFAANDPESTAFVWEHMGLPQTVEKNIALINIRADRMRRSKDLAPLFSERIEAHRLVLIGEQTEVFADILRREGVDRTKIVDLGGRSAEEIWTRLLELTDEQSNVVGIGNIGGVGVRLLDLIDSKEQIA